MTQSQSLRDLWKSRPTPRRSAKRTANRKPTPGKLSRRTLLKLLPVATFVALSEPLEQDEQIVAGVGE